ncbi:hypothetical protein BG006_011182 [Podila minutissima]|uniref:Uncharacterized protein n=1 Tax=Podila minutissima TaxID=64525 RepID=A0A9P5VPM4_9FUNG|nr:hypothetical protein BG006_011182 [Podila minutissima]
MITAMAMARSDINQSFASTNSVQRSLEEELAALHRPSSSSSSKDGTSTPSSDDPTGNSADECKTGPILTRLLCHRDLIPMVIGYLDCRSLLALTSISTRYRREILVPATPNLSCINIFLQLRTIICPMAQFEALKDFMVKYRAFKPVHIHFTYSETSSLMSLVPVVAAPIYNTKTDMTFSHPSTSPLTSSHLYGVNQSISINFTTNSNSLYQHHHPLVPHQVQQQQLHCSNIAHLENTQHENDQPYTYSVSTNSSTTAIHRQTTRTSSNNSTDSPMDEGLTEQKEAVSNGGVSGSSSSASISIPGPTQLASPGPYTHPTSTYNNHHGTILEMHSAPSDSIPVLSSSSSSTQPLSGHGHRGFELSYWQKFALNELFTRLLLFLRTLTIGRTDKPRKSLRDIDQSGVDLSAGVCFFLARCFNVMHDMPETALESVLWMDVTSRDVVLLITMIELRDIMVDERYWKRGYWIVDHPVHENENDNESENENENDNDDGECESEDTSSNIPEGDWDGFYYLINQEGAEKQAAPQPKPPMSQPAPRLASRFSSLRHRGPARRTSVTKGILTATSSPTAAQNEVGYMATSFSKQSIAPLTPQHQISGLGHLVKSNGSAGSHESSSEGCSVTFAPVLGGSSVTVSHSSNNASTSRTGKSASNSSNNATGRLRFRSEPARWQGSGDTADGSSDNHTSGNGLDEKVHPAVQLFENLKEEILEAANSSSLYCDYKQKGRKVTNDNEVWLY